MSDPSPDLIAKMTRMIGPGVSATRAARVAQDALDAQAARYADFVAPTPDLIDALARMLANARTHGNVYMDGSHNPLPSEDKAAERFVSNVRIEERAKHAALVAAAQAVADRRTGSFIELRAALAALGGANER